MYSKDGRFKKLPQIKIAPTWRWWHAINAEATGGCVPISSTKTGKNKAGNASGLGSNSVLFGYAPFACPRPFFHNRSFVLRQTFAGE